MIRVMSRSEKSMVASCRATAPLGEPAAAAAAVTAGSRSLEKAPIRSRASRPMPMRELASVTAMAVTASAPTMATTSAGFSAPIPLYSPSASPHSSTTVSSNTPLRTALRTTPAISPLPVSRMACIPSSRLIPASRSASGRYSSAARSSSSSSRASDWAASTSLAAALPRPDSSSRTAPMAMMYRLIGIPFTAGP